MDFKEVLGKYKHKGAKNKDLKKIFNLEATNKNYYENNLKYRIEGVDQFQREKQQSGNYRFYGKLNFLANLNFDKEYNSVPTFENFNPENSYTFNIYITYPTSVNNEKGVKNLGSYFNGKNNININLDNGLPLFEAQPKMINGSNKAGFIAFLGHNFNVGDIVELFDTTKGVLDKYKIILIENNYFYIESEPLNLEKFFESRTLIDTPNVSNNTSDNNVSFKNNSLLETLKNITESTSALDTVSIINNFTPNLYCKKVKKGRKSEYYVRAQKIIKKIEQIYNGGFSTNYYNEPINLFNQIDSVNRHNYTDNLGRPITSFYLGVVKHAGDKDFKFSSIESNFSNIIDNTFEDEGIETISERIIDGEAAMPSTNTILLESLVEYDIDELMEKEINTINHTFTSNPDFLLHQQAKFKYKPFYEIPVKKFSTYIENTTNENLVNLPSYAYFDKLYQKYRWRDILDIGFFESNGNGINYPFFNGNHYRYINLDFFLKNQNTPKYNYFDGTLIATEFGFNNNIFDSLSGNEENDEENIFINYNKQC